MTITPEDIRIELRRDELTDSEEAFITRKIEEYSLRAGRINPTAPDHIKDEYVLAGVLQAFLTDYMDDVSSFTDGRFSITKASIRRILSWSVSRRPYSNCKESGCGNHSW